MKIVATSCWHLDLVLAGYDWAGDKLAASAREEIMDATHGADLFVHCGDLFDTNRPSPQAYATVFKLFKTLGCPAILIRGNHDPDTLAPFKEIEFNESVAVMDSPCVQNICGKNFLFAGHIRDRDVNGDAQKYVDDVFEHGIREGIVAGFSHLDMVGAKYPTGIESQGIELHMPASHKKLSCMIVNGHIHKRQKIGNVIFCGSLLPTSVSERDEIKGGVILEV